MSLGLLIALVLFIVVLAGLFSWSFGPQYQRVGSFVAAICALLLFLMAVGVVHV